ncbi:MAG: copper-binding protein [Burkholderiaceae bacterium]
MSIDVFRRALIAAALLAPLAVAAQAAPTDADMASGEVRRVSKEQGKITLRHGEIRSLEMPPMTMVFTVRDPKLLDAVKVGDKVRFRAVKEDGGTYVVTAIEPAP